MSDVENDFEDGQEPEELLPANVLSNLVMCNKDNTIAIDVFSDRFSIVVYERRMVGRSSKQEKWIKAPGPYQPNIARALNKVRELMRLKKLAEVKTLDNLIEHEEKITEEVFKTFDVGFRDLKTKLFAKSVSQKEATLDSETELAKPAPVATPSLPAVLSSEELFAAKKASALSASPKRKGRPPRAK